MMRPLLCTLLLLCATLATAQQRYPHTQLPPRPANGTELRAAAPSEISAPRTETRVAPGLQPPGKTRSLRKTTDAHTQTEIGYMANTYGWIGETRSTIAHDPLTGWTGIVYRGSDRSASSDGNTLYARFSNDGGSTWGGETANLSTTPNPRYPNLALSSRGGAAKTVLLWPQSIAYPNGQNTWGDVYGLKADIGGGNSAAVRFNPPPNWAIPTRIVTDQTTGYLYTMISSMEPNTTESLGEVYLRRSTDDGGSWAPVSLDTPVYTTDDIPAGYYFGTIRLDISPNGVMMFSCVLLMESADTPGSVNFVDEGHGVTWRISTDGGLNWGQWNRMFPAFDTDNLGGPFARELRIGWDFDGILDKHDVPHFLVLGSADINPYGISDDLIYADGDTLYNLRNVDSTFTCEVTQIDGSWKLFPIGPVRRVYTTRVSFTNPNDADKPERIHSEAAWARNYDGDKIFAKWISPYLSWHLTRDQVTGQLILWQDTIANIYVNGKHVDSRTSKGGWKLPWNFDTCLPFTPEDSVRDVNMRITDQDIVMCKYTKIAYYAGTDPHNADNSQLHIGYVEWGIAEDLDQDPVFSDQTIWYIDDVTMQVEQVMAVEQVDRIPGDVALSQNYPNPFNPSTRITFTLPHRGNTLLVVYDMLGREAARLVDEEVDAGTHAAVFDASALSSGVYLCRLSFEGQQHTVKMILAR